MPNILVVDDDKDFLNLIEMGLTSAGHIVYPARSGAEAMRALQFSKFHVAVVDMCMPGMNGLDIITMHREQVHDLPFLVITGSDDTDLIHAVLKFKDVEILFKPVGPLEVTLAAERMIRQKAQVDPAWVKSERLRLTEVNG
jgi:two-component system phosphoglycerate transport system response regulator PgtA